MSAREVAVELDAETGNTDIEAVFRAEYSRIARLIARVLRDPSRAEELAVEVLLKWARTPRTHDENISGWLSRAAVRTALDELRREARRARRAQLFRFVSFSPTPEEIRASAEDRERVIATLAALRREQAELLVLRSEGLSYDELACTLALKSASIGTLLARAGQAFRKEYLKRYGTR